MKNFIGIIAWLIAFSNCKNNLNTKFENDENSIIQKNKQSISNPYDSIFFEYISLFPTQFNMMGSRGEIVETKFEEIKKYICKKDNCYGVSKLSDKIVLDYKFQERKDSLVGVIVSEVIERIDSINDDWDFMKSYFYLYNLNGEIIDSKMIAISSQKYECIYELISDTIKITQIHLLKPFSSDKIQIARLDQNKYYIENRLCNKRKVYENKSGRIEYYENEIGHVIFKILK